MLCSSCGKEIDPSRPFCANCGARQPQAAKADAQPRAVTVIPQIPQASVSREEVFLNTTSDLLRWERNLWRISGIALLVLGAFFMLLILSIVFSDFTILGLRYNADNSAYYNSIHYYYAHTESFITRFVLLCTVCEGSLVGIGIASLLTARKIDPHLINMRKDFAPTAKRLESIGRMVCTAVFNIFAFIFYAINFVRIKRNKDTVNGIISKQSN